MNYTLKAELHCHSRRNKVSYFPLFFDSIQTVEEIINEAIEKNIRILAITDHDSLDGYRKALEILKRKKTNILLIPSCEVSTKHGHILAYDIKKEIPRKLGLQETVEEIHKQGGLAVAAHPFKLFFSMGQDVVNYDFDAVEGFNSALSETANTKARKIASEKNLPCIAGSDAHLRHYVGEAIVLFPEKVKTVKDFKKCILENDFKIDYHKNNMLKLSATYIVKNIIVSTLSLFGLA